MRGILPASFFERPTTVVAQELIGKYLVCSQGGEERAGMIVEVEAYDGFSDKASHAHKGKTKRNKPMFGPAGAWYIYLVYGMHWMLNIVTGKKEYPAAVLIRAVMDGKRRINGPARVTALYGIDDGYNTMNAARRTGLWIEDRGVRVPKRVIRQGPRIGVEYAGAWAKKPFRFYL